MSAASFAPRPSPFRHAAALAFVILAALGGAAPAHADRVQVFSVRGAEDVNQGEELAEKISRHAGIRRARFEKVRAELSVTFADGVNDRVVLDMIRAAGVEGVIGPGKGWYRPLPEYPAGADVKLVTNDGSQVGPLEKLRANGKYTVLDVFATWCGPCRLVDARLRELCAARRDIAVRKLNVVDFDSPLAGQLGYRLTALPHLIVFTPSGKRIEFEGYDPEALDAALAKK
ncbi:MAG: TlpA family protein disulfide reductase [Candidatus Eiseniibacteriota bacterium]